MKVNFMTVVTSVGLVGSIIYQAMMTSEIEDLRNNLRDDLDVMNITIEGLTERFNKEILPFTSDLIHVKDYEITVMKNRIAELEKKIEAYDMKLEILKSQTGH